MTTPSGSGTLTSGMYYTNATIAVTPNTGLHPGVTVTVTGYKPNASVAIPEIQPLLYYLEGGPPFPNGPPPYVQILAFTSTDASGNLTLQTNLADPFTGTNGQAYDPNIVCPPNQATTNHLGTSPSASLYEPSFRSRCRIEIAQFGTGSLGTDISFVGAPTPAAPVLNLDQSSANQGQTVNIANGSVRWNANPFYGSSKNATRPGQTTTVLQICGIGGDPNACSTTTGKRHRLHDPLPDGLDHHPDRRGPLRHQGHGCHHRGHRPGPWRRLRRAVAPAPHHQSPDQRMETV